MSESEFDFFSLTPPKNNEKNTPPGREGEGHDGGV